ncbi:hypothetical protein C7M84_020787 [Penaeus vannamei]|uniref:t-SNARE coiled-coil homology domain-containing protein n=1 Tax=Penaeus vannamei TaxID=6689 RepID=A0A3R7P521_PENVA|nr:hypothetical protein C7M84_020787 [Penaeus vannamei]
MTTRRRRAGSESYVEELTVPGASASEHPHQLQTQPAHTQAPYNILPQVVSPWGTPTANVPANQAYYKKTDIVSPGTVPVTSPWAPGQQNMASRDRTQEFARIVRSQQGSLTNGALPHNDGKRTRDLRQYKDFMQRSKLIHRNISSTWAKLEKLTHLARKRSLFDDSHDREIQELTGIIRHDLSSLTKQLGDLRNRSHVSVSGNNTAHLQKHSSNIVGSLQTKVALITQKFKDVLEVRTENLKKQAERREQFTGGAVSSELPPGAVAGHHQGSVLLADEAAASAYSNGEVSINLGQGGAYHQQLQLMEEQDTYLQNRADTMRTIESTIVELGQMFTQLATMVKEQEELVHR